MSERQEQYSAQREEEQEEEEEMESLGFKIIMNMNCMK
jgi:hypothetical protein